MSSIRTGSLALAAALAMGGTALAADVSPVAYPPAPSPVYAPTPIAMGYAELSFGWINLDTNLDVITSLDVSGDDDLGFNGITGAGYANIPFANGWNFELEARGSSVYEAGEGSLLSQVGGYGHGYWRDPSKWAAGIFGGYSNLSLLGSATNLWTLGAEGLYFWNALTLYGQAGYHWLRWEDGGSEAVFLRAAARYFLQPNLRLQGDFQWTSFTSGFDGDFLTLAGTAEYRLAGVPLSGFATVRWDRLDVDVGDVDATSVLIGIRGYLGSGSLLDNDRNGAPLDVLPFPAVAGVPVPSAPPPSP